MTVHEVCIDGLPGEGTMANCTCGGFSEFDTAYGGDFDRLATLVQTHRVQAGQAETEAARLAKLNEKRWHVWVRNSRGDEFAYSSHDDRADAERWAAEMHDVAGSTCWVVDRDAT